MCSLPKYMRQYMRLSLAWNSWLGGMIPSYILVHPREPKYKWEILCLLLLMFCFFPAMRKYMEPDQEEANICPCFQRTLSKGPWMGISAGKQEFRGSTGWGENASIYSFPLALLTPSSQFLPLLLSWLTQSVPRLWAMLLDSFLLLFFCLTLLCPCHPQQWVFII